MQIDPLALSRSGDSVSSTPAVGAKSTSSANNTAAASTSKSSTVKLPSTIPRIDFEPIYTELKAAVGIQWTTYQDAFTRFVQGGLNYNELNNLLSPIFAPSDPSLAAKIESLHNQLICAILSNIGRDMPDPGVASWVSANDKPASAPKPVSGDAAEQRTKTEVKNLPASHRRRIKAAGTLEGIEGAGASKQGAMDLTEMQTARGTKQRKEYEDFNKEKSIKLPEVSPATAGGVTKTNWDLEIRKRYTQPLFSETAELPSEPSTILSRIVPICYEESIPNGCTLPVAEYVSIATEVFVKEFLTTVFARTRSNAPGSGTGAGSMVSGSSAGAGGLLGGVIMTTRYRKQVEREEEAFKRGEIQRSRETGLLPVEAKELAARRPIGVNDMKLAMEIGRGLVGHMPLIAHRIEDAWLDGELEDWKSAREKERALSTAAVPRASVSTSLLPPATTALRMPPTPLTSNMDGPQDDADGVADEMDIDGQTQPPLDDDYGGWEGAAPTDRLALDGLLGDILSAK